MRMIGASFLAVMVVSTCISSAAVAETVHFPTATAPPSLLQQRLARERGEATPERPREEIAGEFYRPSGEGPFPSVVLLHGCAGRGPKAAEDAAAARFVALGYAVLIVDSFGPRGVKERCTEGQPPVDRVADAYGGLLYLAHLPLVDAERVAVVGLSQGGGVAISAVEFNGIDSVFDRHFRTAVAYYPLCAALTGSVSVPTLILIGALDDWAPAQACRDMMVRRSSEGAPMRLVVYPGAYHAFNTTVLRDGPRTVFGHHVEYNEAADRAAWQEVVAALRQAFGR